jgi:hypothetical protein
MLTNNKLIQLFGLGMELFNHAEKQEKRSLPYAWAKNNDTGEMVVYVKNKKHADRIDACLKKAFIDD